MESHDVRWDNYFYPGTNVLKNKLGITDADELQQVEADITFRKLTELYVNPIEGNFDATHYRDIHRYLFEDIYPFAGEFRNVDMRKDFYFVTNSEIEASLDTVLNEMHQDFLKCQCYRDYVIFLAEFYYDILTVHPFREGNGRTTREFLREFVDKYIGLENIELYKQTEIYQYYKEWLMSQEKQNEAVYNIIHWQIIDRNKINDILAQIHLLSFTDRIAVAIIMSSIKIPQVYIDGCFHYRSEVKPLHSDMIIGDTYYNDLLSKTEKYFNVPFKGGAYISRIEINNQFTYIESNDMFDESEIRVLNNIAETFEKESIKQEKEMLKRYEEQKGKE